MRYEFTDIMDAVKALQAAGFGFGQEGTAKGRFYHFDHVRQRPGRLSKLLGVARDGPQ